MNQNSYTFSPFEITRSGDPASIQDGGRHCIHIIDDDAPLGAALSAGLEAHGFRTFFSPSANAGWAEAQARPPDLILCDINMPEKNGHRLLEEIRADPVLANCQFVFMTGNPLFAQPRRGMELGADDFLLKPFSLETLVGCVAARLQRAELHRQGGAQLLRELRGSLRETLPHEFFTPLTGIIGFAELLEEDLHEAQHEQARGVARDILRSGQRLHRTLRNYLAVLGLDDRESTPPLEDLSAATVGQLITRGVRTAVLRHERAADLTLELVAAPLRAAPRDLTLLAEELTDNAFSFSRRGHPVRVVVAPTGDKLWMNFIDQGRGMTTPQLQAIGTFHQFERRRFEQQGLGLGLTLVRRALRRLGGALSFTETSGGGVTAEVSLPIGQPPSGKETATGD